MGVQKGSLCSARGRALYNYGPLDSCSSVYGCGSKRDVQADVHSGRLRKTQASGTFLDCSRRAEHESVVRFHKTRLSKILIFSGLKAIGKGRPHTFGQCLRAAPPHISSCQSAASTLAPSIDASAVLMLPLGPYSTSMARHIVDYRSRVKMTYIEFVILAPCLCLVSAGIRLALLCCSEQCASSSL